MSLDRTWPITALGCLVFEHDCIEFDFEDHRVTVLSGPRTHRRGHICRHSGVRIRDSTYSAVPAVTSEQNMLARWVSSSFRRIILLRRPLSPAGVGEDLSASGLPEYFSVC